MRAAAGRDPYLAHLYEISKLFANTHDTVQPVDAAVAVIARALKIRCAILTHGEGQPVQRTVWSEKPRGAPLGEARARMSNACTYLLAVPQTRRAAVREVRGATPLPRQPRSRRTAHRFIVLPLVTPWRSPFGALLLEGAQPFSEADLRFISAVANQVAMALDHARHRRQDVERREEAEKGRLLAEQSRRHAEEAQARAEGLLLENARLYEQAQHAVRVREQVLAIVSHDLRNPLSTIMMSATVLDREPPQQERRKDMPVAIARIRRASHRMMRLIDDLLDFASIEAGQLKVMKQPEDARTLIHESIAALEGVARASEIALKGQVLAPLPAVTCDRDRILQVFGNLVGNALKVTPARGQITLSASQHPRHLLFSVADDGPGIAPDAVGHLFDRYWRGDDVKYRGSGLGLAVSRGIVEAHGGKIWVESKQGFGATFYFTLPTEPAAARN